MRIKTSFAFIIAIFSLFACSKEKIRTPDEGYVLTTKSGAIPHAVTEDMAKAFIASVFPEKTVSSISSVVEEGLPLLWIVNFDEGWVIISGDKRTNIILSQSKEGQYHYGESIPPVDAWMAGYAEEVKAISQSDWEGNKESLDIWESICPSPIENKPQTKADEEGPIWVRTTISHSYNVIDSTSIPHLMITKWGQEEPWNTNVPYYFDSSSNIKHYPVGCVAVAVGQILYYLHNKDNFPTGLYEAVINNHYLPFGGTNPYFQHYDYADTSARWSLMPLDSISLGNTSYVSDLLADIGNAANMSYGVSGSSAAAPVSVFNHYGLTCSGDTDFVFQTAFLDIQSGYPLSIGAKGYHNTNETFHYFVADGNVSKSMRYEIYYEWHVYPDMEYIYEHDIPLYFYLTDEDMQTYDPDMYNGKQTSATSFYTSEYLYMNWGFDGNYDYVQCGTTVPDHWTANGINYDYNRRMIYNIR